VVWALVPLDMVESWLVASNWLGVIKFSHRGVLIKLLSLITQPSVFENIVLRVLLSVFNKMVLV
jgi:hypothetical protein